LYLQKYKFYYNHTSANHLIISDSFSVRLQSALYLSLTTSKSTKQYELFERDRVLEETEMLKIFLDFHIQNRAFISMDDREFEECTNAVLDRLNELCDLLGDKTEEE